MLQIENLTMHYEIGQAPVKAIRNVNLSLEKGEIIGLVGESGCGKSTVLMAIMGLIAHPGRIIDGAIVFKNKNLTSLSASEMRRLRGNVMAMIFQDPMTTLNPVFKVGEQIREVLKVHRIVPGRHPFRLFDRLKKQREKEIVLGLMQEVGIPSEKDRYNEFPHEFSGGMQQRALIAAALSCQPDLLLADEPTTALDVTIQAQIVALLQKINKERGTAIILVTHDLALAAEFCHRIAVMYAGEIVEIGATGEIIQNPQHPYTRGLLRSIPRISEKKEKISPISGMVADLAHLPVGCAFGTRCRHHNILCDSSVKMTRINSDRQVRCVLADEAAS